MVHIDWSASSDCLPRWNVSPRIPDGLLTPSDPAARLWLRVGSQPDWFAPVPECTLAPYPPVTLQVPANVVRQPYPTPMLWTCATLVPSD